MRTEYICQWERHGVFDLETINSFDCPMDCFILAATIRQPNKRCLDPFRGCRLHDIAECSVQEVKIIPVLVAIHLAKVQTKQDKFWTAKAQTLANRTSAKWLIASPLFIKYRSSIVERCCHTSKSSIKAFANRAPVLWQ